MNYSYIFIVQSNITAFENTRETAIASYHVVYYKTVPSMPILQMERDTYNAPSVLSLTKYHCCVRQLSPVGFFFIILTYCSCCDITYICAVPGKLTTRMNIYFPTHFSLLSIQLTYVRPKFPNHPSNKSCYRLVGKYCGFETFCSYMLATRHTEGLVVASYETVKQNNNK